MNVGVFFSPWSRTALPTGVGRHAIEMTRHLHEHNDVNVSMFTTADRGASSPPGVPSELSPIPSHLLPGSDRFSRMLFIGLRCRGIDRWASEADWVYCPKEQPVATSRARLAVNVHDTLTFEPPVDGLQNETSWRNRLRWKHAMWHIGRADLVTTVSEFTKSRLVDRLHMDADRIVVTGNGVSNVFFRQPQPEDRQVLERYGVESGRYFLSVGSLTRRKGGDLLLEAARRVQQTGHNVPLLITGRRHDADLKAEHEAAAERDPENSVRLVGYVSDDDQAVLLTHAMALLFPSRYEGFGIPALEAMAAGTVVVSTTAAALPEVVGDAGRMIAPNNVDQLTQEMTSLLEGRTDRRTLIEKGRQRASHFRWRSCTDRLVQAMRERSTR